MTGISINQPVKLNHLASLGAAVALTCGISPGQQKPQSPAIDPSEAVVEAETITPQTVAAAEAAVTRLCKEVELGRYQVAVERMNPQWKQRTAERMGGVAALQNQLDKVAAQMVQQGVSIISSRVSGKATAFEVKPGKKTVRENGATIEKTVHTKWLVLVPTTTRFRVLQPGTQKAVMIDSLSFQAAISDKDKNDWTFIDGASLNVSDLRGLFPTLPKDMTLPPVKKQEVK